MLILGAAVYITQTSKEDDRSPCHPSSIRADNCEVPTLPADAKFGWYKSEVRVRLRAVGYWSK
jgi:hypothetical protein